MSKFLTEILVEFSKNIYQQGIPSDVTNKIIELFIDKVGLIIGGSQFPWSLSTYHAITQFSAKGQANVAYFGDQLSAEQAAFINAAFGHAQDFDDTHLQAITHPGGVIIPTALAIADEVQAENTQTIRAVAAGLEIMTRIAYAVPACHSKGFHTPLVAGPFGAAMTASLLLGLSQEQCIHALNIAGSFAGGLWEYTQSGGNIKRNHCGIAASNGIKAAFFAAHGITGPASILEGKFGVCNSFDDGSHIQRLTDQLGQKYLISTVALKYYNSPYSMQAAIEALLEIFHSEKIKVEEIEEIDVGSSQFVINHVGKIRHPKNPLEAQFSLYFTLALTLIKGAPGMLDYSESNINNPEIFLLSKKVSLYKDEIADSEQSDSMGSIVTITTISQKRYEKRVRFAKGTPQNMLSLQEIESKFKKCVEPVLPKEKIDFLLQKIKNFPSLKSSTELTKNW